MAKSAERATDSIALVEQALAEIRKGRMVILTDDEDRENEGDLVMAAEKVTPEAINFMATHGRGLICLSLTEERLRQLNLPLMVQDNTSPFQTAFTVSHRGGARASPPASPPPTARSTMLAAVAPRRQARRPGAPRAHLPAARARGRGAGAHRPDRGLGGPGAHGRASCPPASSAR